MAPRTACATVRLPPPSLIHVTDPPHQKVWSNFEIADMDFWRSEAYTAFFEYLDRSGGFYYEARFHRPNALLLLQTDGDIIKRWGDAPVHSIAVALFAGKDRIQFFREIGYEHSPYTHCPAEEELWKSGRCTCDPAHSFGKLNSYPI
jgi:alpha 1,2-mannosyltransferase